MLTAHHSRRLAAAAASLLAFVGVWAMLGMPRARLERAVAQLDGARPVWLWLAGGAFVAALLCAAGAWRSALRRCGGDIGRAQAAARYGVGSLVNSVAPAWAGEAVRVLLFSKALDGPDGAWTSGGILAAIASARALVLGVLVVVGCAIGVLPLWPVILLFAIVCLTILVSLIARRREAVTRISHLLDAFRALGRSPRGALPLLGWVAAWTAARLGAAAAIGAALGVPAPLAAALIIVPALDVAGLVPLTPGNLGVTSGAVAVALQSRGIDPTKALSAGLVLHAVEMIVGLSCGLAAVLFLSRFRSASAHRRTMVLAAASAALVLAGAFGATVLVDLA